ncbi:uncharacterized protein LOC106178472 isoform X2 [Lingula anatina]|nr:uncharacterized protein LOC106178472 isoform X2 [Lingula anatina]|eukprot:XP_013417117.1 uncharacterized protein LOC106178472 isoform X2 [Lingula anatina]
MADSEQGTKEEKSAEAVVESVAPDAPKDVTAETQNETSGEPPATDSANDVEPVPDVQVETGPQMSEVESEAKGQAAQEVKAEELVEPAGSETSDTKQNVRFAGEDNLPKVSATTTDYVTVTNFPEKPVFDEEKLRSENIWAKTTGARNLVKCQEQLMKLLGNLHNELDRADSDISRTCPTGTRGHKTSHSYHYEDEDEDEDYEPPPRYPRVAALAGYGRETSKSRSISREETPEYEPPRYRSYEASLSRYRPTYADSFSSRYPRVSSSVDRESTGSADAYVPHYGSSYGSTYVPGSYTRRYGTGNIDQREDEGSYRYGSAYAHRPNIGYSFEPEGEGYTEYEPETKPLHRHRSLSPEDPSLTEDLPATSSYLRKSYTPRYTPVVEDTQGDSDYPGSRYSYQRSTVPPYATDNTDNFQSTYRASFAPSASKERESVDNTSSLESRIASGDTFIGLLSDYASRIRERNPGRNDDDLLSVRPRYEARALSPSLPRYTPGSYRERQGSQYRHTSPPRVASKV